MNQLLFFVEESVSRILEFLKWIAAAVMLENMVTASLWEEKCAASTWTFVMVAGWLSLSTSLIDWRRRLRVMATECAQPASILLHTVIGVPENPAT